MAWTAPATVVATQVWTASAFNSNVRDNLLETAVGKATTAGSLFITTAANSIEERYVSSHTVAASETTTSLSYTDLATVGPTISVNTGTAATVIINANISNNTSAVGTFASVEVSGASTVSVSDEWAIKCDGMVANYGLRGMSAHRFTGLTAGINTFTMKYKVESASTGTFVDRHIVVLPF